MSDQYPLAMLKSLPTLWEDNFFMLKISSPNFRVWLHKHHRIDGNWGDNVVTVEKKYKSDWIQIDQYEAK